MSQEPIPTPAPQPPAAVWPRPDCETIAGMPLPALLYHILAGDRLAGGDYLPV
jgi:hypothetical protein